MRAAAAPAGQKSRREEIMEAALRIFYQKGFYPMKMEEVAQAAGIGKGTVYEYFRSKEELMAAAIDFEFAAVEAKVTEAMNRETSMTDKLAALVATVIRHQQSQKDIVKVSFQEISGCMQELQQILDRRNELYLQQINSLLRQKAEQGEIRNVEPQLFFGMLMGALFGLSRSLKRNEAEGISFDCHGLDPQEKGRQIAELLMHGLAGKSS